MRSGYVAGTARTAPPRFRSREEAVRRRVTRTGDDAPGRVRVASRRAKAGVYLRTSRSLPRGRHFLDRNVSVCSGPPQLPRRVTSPWPAHSVDVALVARHVREMAGMRLVDLSQTVSDGLVTYPGLPGPTISDHLSFEASHEVYAEGTEFTIGRIEMVSNTGTYLDTPGHRHRGRPRPQRAAAREVRAAAGRRRGRPGDRRRRGSAFDGLDVAGAAVLVRTGWSSAVRHRGVRRAGAPLPGDRRGRSGWPTAGRRARRHRLGEHRRHPRRRAAGAHAAPGPRDPDRRAPDRPRPAAAAPARRSPPYR